MSLSPGSTVDNDEYFKTDPGIPFHLLRRKKASQPANLQLTGQFNIHGLDEAFSKFSKQNIKDGLSSFLPHLPGYVDAPGTPQDSLQALIDKPPVGGRELLPLTESALSGFRLMPGSVPDQFKFMNKPPEKKKKKKHRHHDESTNDGSNNHDSTQDRKHKKRKKDETGEKKKKEKKKKKKKDRKGEDD